MANAAGIAFRCNGQVLLIQRGPDGDFPGTWAVPGGGVEAGESDEQAARREVLEECCYDSSSDALEVLRSDSHFITFAADVAEPFAPTLNHESTDYVWAPLGALPEPMHPECVATLCPDELTLARGIAAGAIDSPQQYGSMWLFAMRITGTGTAYRRKLDEFVYRPPENYLTDEFLARCMGLPVIFEHPEKNTLDSDEYADRNVGSIMLPYIVADEVWGVARIYDESAAAILNSQQMSTSPTVEFYNADVNSTMQFEDGSQILIEGKPSVLDHLAICDAGVWDKGLAPSGVKTDSLGDVAMPEENVPEIEKQEDAKIDQMLALLTSMNKRLEAVESAKSDNADLPSDPIPVAADEQIEPEEPGLSKADAEQIRKEMSELSNRMPRDDSDEERAEKADAQARADSVANAFGERASAPLLGESPMAYRKRLAAKFQSHSKQYAGVNIASISDAALFSVVEKQIYSDAQAASSSPAIATPGMLREVHTRDVTGRQISTFVGDAEACWAPFKAPKRRVTQINK